MSSRSINRVVILGNLTRDPELKYTPTGAPVCSFGVATNRSWTTQDGQTKEDTQYHRITAWNKVAELCGKLLSKGRKIYVEGRLVYRTFTGKDGVQRTITEIILEDFIVFSDGVRRAAELDEQASKTSETQSTEQVHEEHSETTPEAPVKSEPQDETINPDDIPF